eukprot:g20465.t1
MRLNFGLKPSSKPTRKEGGVDWYDFFAKVIADQDEDADDYKAIIRKRTKDDLEPEDSRSLPLLVLAKDKPKWFRHLIEGDQCDPTVTWKENGVDMSLRKVLRRQRTERRGKEVYGIFRARMERFKSSIVRRENMDNNEIPTEVAYQAELDLMGIGVAVAGVTAVTAVAGAAALGGAAAIGGAAAMGGVLPISGVCTVILEAFKKWNTTFNASRPTEELRELFRRNAETLGSILTQLNARIEAAKKAKSEDLALAYKYEEEKRRVDTLKFLLLKHAAKEVESIRKQRDISVEKKKEQLVEMLDKLHAHQERLHVLDMLDKIDAGLDDSKTGVLAHGLPRLDSSVEQDNASSQQVFDQGSISEHTSVDFSLGTK